jgi:hypothetical protein
VITETVNALLLLVDTGIQRIQNKGGPACRTAVRLLRDTFLIADAD